MYVDKESTVLSDTHKKSVVRFYVVGVFAVL